MTKRITYCLLLIFTAGMLAAQDVTPPDIPELQYVSVDPMTNVVTVAWLPCDSADTRGYIIYKKPENWEPYDTIDNPLAGTYLDITSEAGLHSELYRIAAYDSSGNLSPMTDQSEYHNTIYIFPYQVRQNCIEKIKVTFNSYQYWPDGVQGYKIYRDVDYSGVFTVVDTAAYNANVYYDLNIENGKAYCYYIEAFSPSGKTSKSNWTCKIASLPDTMRYINADFATVEDYDLVKVTFTIDTVGDDVTSFSLLSSDHADGPYSVVKEYGSIPTTSVDYSEYLQINSDMRYYKLVAFNECGLEEESSNPAHNIIASVKKGEGLKHIIRWNPYSTWNGTVDHYLVYRIDQDNSTELISTELDTSCTIDISEYLEQKVSGEFCYYIEAYEKDNPYNVNGISRSNLACIAEDPLIFFPNAFTPDHDGLNDEFRPVVSFSSTIDYEFRVYDRWGEIIFRSQDPTEGWNGKIHGRNAKEGVYIYYVCFTSALNKVFEQRGFFSLIYQ